jgi:uncharacterized protein (TIGR02271 family)
MTNQTGQTSQRLLTAFFDNREDAHQAVEGLASMGIPRRDITMVEGSERGRTGAYVDQEGTGFWEALKDLFLPEEDRYTYAEGLRRGGYLVSVRVSDAQYGRALDILDDEGTINIDERAEAWRVEGWTGYGAGSPAATRAASEREEVIPVTEEELRVGRREVGQGRVRVRSYVVEQPVQEQVGLRQERVDVERRPVDRPVSGDESLFRERTIEAEEKAEEPVVSKEARVKEEVVVRKDVDQRTETVADTVRRTEVDVEDQRQDRATGTKGKTEADRKP